MQALQVLDGVWKDYGGLFLKTNADSSGYGCCPRAVRLDSREHVKKCIH